MRFSSMAVSILAQSVPLLAVGHLAGWKTRERRSWLKRRRLRDALLVGVHAKKGMLFEKRVGVHGKHDDVLEKKRAGSARLEQDGASSEVPSDHAEGTVECDPLSKVTDSGIFRCGIDSHCVDSEKSKLGGFCVDIKQASSINRALQQDLVCVDGTNEDGVTSDCSQFNSTTGVGTIITTYPEESCLDEAREVCGVERSYAINADGSYANGYCFDPTSGGELVDDFCYSTSFSALGYEEGCEVKVNGVVCNSCALGLENCPANSEQESGAVFDCTNTDINKQGNACDTMLGFLSSLDGTESPSVATTEESMTPTAVVDELSEPSPEPTRSSGGCLSAKMTIVVSAVVTAWLASFGL